MKHFFLSTFLALLLPTGMLAGGTQHITINGMNVEKTALRITFDGDDAILHFADGTSQQADMAGIVIDFAAATSISAYRFPGSIGNQLSLNGLAEGTPASLYDASGRLVATTAVSAQPWNTSDLRPGLYILKAGNIVIKFNKK